MWACIPFAACRARTELVAVLAFVNAALGRDPRVCFGFASIFAVLFIVWNECKRVAGARARGVASKPQ